MFSICLNGAAMLDGDLQQPGLIVFTSVHSTVPDLSASCRLPSRGVPTMAPIQSLASASISAADPPPARRALPAPSTATDNLAAAAVAACALPEVVCGADEVSVGGGGGATGGGVGSASAACIDAVRLRSTSAVCFSILAATLAASDDFCRTSVDGGDDALVVVLPPLTAPLLEAMSPAAVLAPLPVPTELSVRFGNMSCRSTRGKFDPSPRRKMMTVSFSAEALRPMSMSASIACNSVSSPPSSRLSE
mmetsp:Transcript_6866/g.17832  ORF Transcript_6866/g.17832 Transcript_6866/m.17832 type:complete len:249 (-) Transcript_6866:327-1073(-)